MNAPTQLDPEMSTTATRLRHAAPSASDAERPALDDIRRGAHRRRARRRTATGAAAVMVLGALTATTIAVRHDGGSTASTLNDPIDVAIAQTQPLVPKLGPGEKFDYAIVQGDPTPPTNPDQIIVLSDVSEPTLASRAIVASVTALPAGTSPITTDSGSITTIGDRSVEVNVDPAGVQALWTEQGFAVFLTGRNLTEPELTSFIKSVLVVGFDIRDASNPTATTLALGMRQISSRPRPGSIDMSLQWGVSTSNAWTIESFTGTSMLEHFAWTPAGELAQLRRPTGMVMATVFRGGDGVALGWEEPAGTVRLLSSTRGDDVDGVISMAESLQSIDGRSLRSLLTEQGTTVESHIADDPAAGETANTDIAAATTAVAQPQPGGNRLGDSASLTTGPIFVMTGDGMRPAAAVLQSSKVHLGIIRTASGEPWSLMLYETNPAGVCFLTPISGASITDPDAPFFTNECDHSTYTIDGRCLDGCTIGLYATKLDEHDGAIWGDITRFDSRRPKV